MLWEVNNVQPQEMVVVAEKKVYFNYNCSEKCSNNHLVLNTTDGRR
jgi:hypothetical protein